jgi:parvulin-like peptidyl-prolyl isomerase
MRLCPRRINLLISVAVVICLFTGPAWADEAASSGKDIASVNGKAISKSEFDRMLSGFEKRAERRGRPLKEADLTTVKNRILENLIDAEVLYQQSQKEGIKIDEKVINERIEKMKKRFPDESGYKKAIERMNVSEKEFRAAIQRALAINELLYKVRQKITVTDKESKKYYNDNLDLFKKPEQVKISQIFIKVKPDDEQSKKIQARKKLETVQEKLTQGEDFGKLAKAYSEGPNAQRGGVWGYFRRGQMEKSIEDVAFALKVGEVSKIVESSLGYYLIKVTDKIPAGTIPYKEAQSMIEKRVKKEKEKTEIQNYIGNLKKSADIKRFN